MYQILATKMAISSSTDEVTQPVAMAGANAVTVDMTVFSGSVTTVSLEGSNDLENWAALNSTMLASGALSEGAYYLPCSASGAAFTGAEKDVSTQYVRIKFGVTSGTAIAGAGLNTASL